MTDDIKKALTKFKPEDFNSPEAFRAAAAKAGLTEAQTAEALERMKSVELSDQELSSIVGGVGNLDIITIDNTTYDNLTIGLGHGVGVENSSSIVNPLDAIHFNTTNNPLLVS